MPMLASALSSLGCSISQSAIICESSISWCLYTWGFANVSVNSLFGLVFDEKRYKDVLRICQLTTDLDLLEDGGKVLRSLSFFTS